jgi:hypothetical protein
MWPDCFTFLSGCGAWSQVRARTAPPHPVVDVIYPAFAALAAFEAALLDPPASCQLSMTAQSATEVMCSRAQTWRTCLTEVLWPAESETITGAAFGGRHGHVEQDRTMCMVAILCMRHGR